MEIKTSDCDRVNGEGEAPSGPWQSVPTGSGRGIDQRILLMSSGGGQRVLYPDSGEELTCHQSALTDATENSTTWHVFMPGCAVATLTPYTSIFPKVHRH